MIIEKRNIDGEEVLIFPYKDFISILLNNEKVLSLLDKIISEKIQNIYIAPEVKNKHTIWSEQTPLADQIFSSQAEALKYS